MADTIIEEVGEDGIFAYQDDFLIASKSFEESCRKLQKILQVFAKHNLTLNPKKCSFHQSKVQYLGFEVSQHVVTPIQSNIVKINSFPRPKTKRQTKRLIGICGYYRHLIPAYAKLINPLIKLTSYKEDFHWTQEHQEAFDKLQKIFLNKPFVIQPNFNEDFYLNTDASSFAISAILMQKRGEDLLPISYFSKTLSNSEKKYPAIKLELMAIYKGVLAFKYFLCGRHFIILSDSKPLKHYSKVVSPVDITSRWLLALGEYEYTFIHLPGKENLLADFFSRTPFPDSSTLSSDPNLLNSSEILPIHNDEVINVTKIKARNPEAFDDLLKSVENIPADPLLELTNNTILKEQLKDPKLSEFYKAILNDEITKESVFFEICPESKILLFKKSRKDGKEVMKIAMPSSLRSKAIRISHVPHYGIHKTYETISKKYFWRSMYQDTANFVQSCDHCISSKPHRIPQAPFQNNPLPSHPGDFVSMDLVGPFSNNFHILTIIDRFSRHLQLYPLKSISSQSVINALFQYITTHGRPSLVHTDLGKQFTSQIFNDFNSKFGIRLIHSTPHHPQANAISERINQSIKSTIKALQLDGYNFFNAIQIHQMMYNAAIHSSTSFSPNVVHFGRNISTLYDTYLPFKPFLATDKNTTYFSIMQDLDKIYQKVYGNLQLAQTLQNSRQHQHAKMRNFKSGDIVYMKSSHTYKGSYSGPFKVIKNVSPVNVIIQREGNPASREFKVHIDRLWLSKPRRQHLIPDANASLPTHVADQTYVPDTMTYTSNELSSHLPVTSESVSAFPDSQSQNPPVPEDVSLQSSTIDPHLPMQVTSDGASSASLHEDDQSASTVQACVAEVPLEQTPPPPVLPIETNRNSPVSEHSVSPPPLSRYSSSNSVKDNSATDRTIKTLSKPTRSRTHRGTNKNDASSNNISFFQEPRYPLRSRTIQNA